MRHAHTQSSGGVRFDWGPVGAQALASDNGCLVVIDVLSFTTAVTVAVSRGIDIIPYPWRSESVHTFAGEHNALVAVDRSEMNEERPWSLSPISLLHAKPVNRLVLRSLNGATIASHAKSTVIAACLRNGAAVAEWLVNTGYGTKERPIGIIASGERWSVDGSLRPCLEDQLAAGYVARELQERGCVLSVEAKMAVGAFSAATDIATQLIECASGRELVEEGYKADVVFSAEVGVDVVVPVLIDGRFQNSNVIATHAGTAVPSA